MWNILVVAETHPLDRARARIDRATAHLAELDQQLFEWIHAPIVDTKLTEGVFFIEWTAVVAPPPPQIQVLAVEVVDHVRAALEYVAWELAVKHHWG